MAASAADRKRRDRDADVLADLAAKHMELDRDVIEIDEEKWAIHGRIAYEGEVIAATFASEHEAWAGLSRLEEIERDHLHDESRARYPSRPPSTSRRGGPRRRS